MVQWNQRLEAFSTHEFSHLTLSLYAKRSARPNILLGTREISIPVASQSDVPFALNNGDRQAGQSTEPVTLYLTTAVSAIMAFPTPHGQANMLPTEARIALRRADESTKLIDGSDTWEKAVGRIKWVMDTLSPIMDLHPFAQIAYGLVSAIPKTLIEQYQRDGKALALLEAMHDVFDLADHEETLKFIKPGSKQAQILTVMLRDVCSCGVFIQSYAKDSEFCTLLSSPISRSVLTCIFQGSGR
ncbi:hypothetical protein H4582DRAFT_906757 [Lactarius indigo]|nr:hypothetical protein H4582DRAFT_906757 [Lactarius indigo]